METKLTKDDYEGYLSHVSMRMKQSQMILEEGKKVTEWLKEKISKCPTKTTLKGLEKKGK